ncbi:PREDICTED: symplekin [Nicrophorus vespilloides]|uniref:Symplekin n=1 Tax=Nicrophorus vespilloides TaxID=110193 RepID=A0ABM1MQT8_NICVS|nr:PREDICTED: symplekin [Nicrophorus vespilloides]
MSTTFFNPEPNDEDLINGWYNNAIMSPQEASNNLRKIQEVLLNKSPNLLPEYLDNILGQFTQSTNGDVKKVLVGFIEEACKYDENLMPKVTLSLLMLLNNENVALQKRVIQSIITLYRRMLIAICKASCVTEEMETAWGQMNEIKSKIIKFIDSDNDGVRTSVVKFLETVVLLQSYPDPNESSKNDFTLEDVPLTLKIARRRKLEEEANTIFDILIKFNGSPHISSANLYICIGSLTHIGKNRPDYIEPVIHALVELTSNFPPTLSMTQVSTVKKKLKTEFISIIKHPAAHDYIEKISPILIDFGLTQNEINKMIPKVDENRKYTKRTLSPDTQERATKKPRLDIAENDPDYDLVVKQKQALEVNENFIKDKLSKNLTVELVLKGLYDVPSRMPSIFKTDYAESLKLGPAGDIGIVAKLLSEQMVEAGVGPGSKIIGKTMLIKDKLENKESKKRLRDEDDEDEVKSEKLKKGKLKAPRVKVLKLNEITRPLDKKARETLLLGAIKRLLKADHQSNKVIRQKIITTVAATFNDIVRENVLSYVLEDIKGHLDLALAWLYEEYSIMQGFSRIPELRRSSRIEQSYNTLLSSFVEAAQSDSLTMSRLLLESPIITDQVLNQLKQVCKDENNCEWGILLLRDLVLRRPTRQLMFLNALLENITHENMVIRECTISHVVELHKCVEIRQNIEEYVRKCLEYLGTVQPPDVLFGFAQGRLAGADAWNDDIAKACLEGYVALLPSNQSLIHDLAKIYVQTGADTKRVILRLLEVPIRLMGMDSVELLKLVQECPKGSETLVTRVIHILTDKGPPTAQLVKRVRDLYNTRVSDVRFLIPVLNGLTKSEILAALPKLIKLNPVVVREVFNRLLGVHGDSAITPTELLVALHILSTDQVDIKTKMKAITMCLNDKQVFTQEILAVVLQQLMEQTPLPTLLMRTVIQALGLFPRLSGFVMNILQRLILKQVWKQKVAWEGFVKCCQRTKPQSFSVLMQLPAPQLAEALTMSSDLREPLKEHLLNFNDNQRAHVPAAVQEVILGPEADSKPPTPVLAPVEILKTEPVEPLPPGMD